jgi:hypothetical protein
MKAGKRNFGVTRRWLGARSGQGVWRPLTLRWRRERRGGARVIAIATTKTLAATIWVPVSHHHSSAFLRDCVRVERVAAVAGAAHTSTVLVDRVRTFAKYATALQSTRFERSVLSTISRPPAAVASPEVRPQVVAPQAGPSLARPDRPRIRVLNRDARQPGTHTRARELHVETVARTHLEWYACRAHPMVLASTSERHANIAGRRTHAALEPATELVWRREQERTADNAGRAASHTGPELSRGTRTFASPAASHPASAAAPTVPQQQVTAIDSALMDRLAEDVIRRVERRVRIDRERRGL